MLLPLCAEAQVRVEIEHRDFLRIGWPNHLKVIAPGVQDSLIELTVSQGQIETDETFGGYILIVSSPCNDVVVTVNIKTAKGLKKIGESHFISKCDFKLEAYINGKNGGDVPSNFFRDAHFIRLIGECHLKYEITNYSVSIIRSGEEVYKYTCTEHCYTWDNNTELKNRLATLKVGDEIWFENINYKIASACKGTVKNIHFKVKR